MKRFWMAGLVALLLLQARPVAAASDVPADAIQAVKNFFRALYVDRGEAALAKCIVTPAESGRILKNFPPAKESLAKAVDIVSVNLPPFYQKDETILPPYATDIPTGSTATFSVYFNEVLTGLPMVKQADGWKVDERFLLGSREKGPLDSPEMVAKRFLLSIFQKDRKTLSSLITSSQPSDMDLLMKANDFPGGDLDVIIEGAEEMCMVRARPGEILVMPSRRALKVEETETHTAVIGLYGMITLPFELQKVNGTWKVVPEPYVLMLRGCNII